MRGLQSLSRVPGVGHAGRHIASRPFRVAALGPERERF